MSDEADELFVQAREILDAQEREVFLERSCSNKPELRARIQALLDDDAQAESYFASHDPQGKGDTIRLSFDQPESDLPGEQEGQRIGRYKLLQRIGEGGFGSVWMAEQTEPVIRKVALKIIKQGMDTREVIARFEAERQALAMMDHPNIAKVLDAGATETGRPYFVMELVKGMPVTEFCNQRQLDIRQRLQLFAEICAAVHHAHQKGIIHRDIKPSNVLVTLHGDRAVPMVIDFGIAKATQARLTARTLFTRFDQFIGTPVYMSPEQAALSGLDIDTRSDIYSLGMLLYELLTGKPPFDPRSLYEAGFDEMRRIIVEEEPPRPSVQLASTVGAEADLLATSHQAEPHQLSRFLRGDLDWIVMKAISKDREQRYQSASDFMADIQHHLADEPVMATPPSATYRLRKAWRRNKIVFTAAAAVLVSLVLGTAVSTWQAIRAREFAAESLQARQEAVTKGAAERAAREESDAVVEFLVEMIQSPDPTREGYKVTVAETLGRAVTNLNASLSGRPALRAHLQSTIGLTYQALGLNRESIPLLEQALEYFRPSLSVKHRVMRTTMSHLADCYITADRYEEGRRLYEELFELTRRDLGPEHPETVSAMARLGDSCRLAGRSAEAVTLQEEALRISRRTSGGESSQTIDIMSNLANLYRNANRNKEAVKLLEEALPLSRKVNGPNAPGTIWLMSTLGLTYFKIERPEDGFELVEAALTLSRQFLGPEHPDTIVRLGHMAEVYFQVGRREDALRLREEALPLARKVHDSDHHITRNAISDLAESYRAIERYEEERKLYEELYESTQRDLGPEHPETVSAMAKLGKSCRQAGRFADAVALQEEALRISRKTGRDQHPQTIDVMCDLANVYGQVNRIKEAVELLEEALPLSRKVNGTNASTTIWLTSTLGHFHFRAGRRAEGIESIETGLALSRQFLGPEHSDTIFRLGLLADVCFVTGRRDDAIRLREEALPLARKVHGPDHHITRDAMSRLANFYLAAGRAVDALPLLTETFSATNDPGVMRGMKLAALQLWFGEKALFDRTRRQILESNAKTDRTAECERAAKVACLQPIPELAMQEAVLTLARRAAKLGQADVELPWFQLALGMARFRVGDFIDAEKSLTDAARGSARNSDKTWVYHIGVTARFYVAMCQFQLGHSVEARQAFEMAAAEMKPIPADPRELVAGDYAHDDMILWLAYKEAKNLLAPSKPVQP